MPVMKVNAHLHTPYSFSAFIDIDDALDRAVKEGVKVVGINDFYTTSGYDAWAEGCKRRNLFPLFGIEFISLNEADQRAGLRVNDPGNPGRTYMSGKGMSYPFMLDEPYATQLASVRKEANDQVEAMCGKLNELLLANKIDFSLDFEWIKNELTKGSIRERHLAKALRMKVYEFCGNEETFVFTNNENLKANIEISHFGENVLKGKQVEWKVKNALGKTISQGILSAKDIQIGNCQQLGEITIPLSFIKEAEKMILEVKLGGTEVSNNWDFWVYPEILPQVDTTSVYICDKMDDKLKSVLNNGGSVLLQLAGKVTQGKDVVQQLVPAFWNTSWFKMRPPHTTGILINDFHPVFRDFPTDYYSNLQWWELANRAQVMELTDFPKSFQPIVQPIDTWFINRRLAMLFEAKVGNGKIIVCSADIQKDPDKRIVARQLRYSILKYMNSNLFLPENELTLEVIENLTIKRGEWLDMSMTKDAPDELKKNI